MLDAIPDLRPSMRSATSAKLADLFNELRATVTPELVPEDEKPRPSDTRSGISSIAGAGFGHLSPTLAYRLVEVIQLP
jgi:hypothetical protein